ncbi:MULTISPECIES: DUF1905 domain-containing protein [unclassified Crossiella]|uniref:DUF1905 domain-containing protein n=1 Tax=unclassified Crossiella TaxID=2620835 RepID=UPI001FFE96B2|nr:MULTISPECIES: DUF1905 domain-containing protein [unclassified Crossiella]MCK2239418.1 DUF1905 domain-containing protein [Crossiella sp. S99.2]MCK2252113.1 DUF1905 domain-containing protein [Crossiella sp. S99.1]
MADPGMRFEFDGVVWEWRGPAPFHFVTVPAAESALIRDVAATVTYGWGMVPVEVVLGRSRWRTSLYAKDGGYVLPLRDSVRNKENIALDDVVQVSMTLRVR